MNGWDGRYSVTRQMLSSAIIVPGRRLHCCGGWRSRPNGPPASVTATLRVSIRRLAQCLRVFGQFFPRERGKKIQHRLRTLMDLASAVRDIDIALELLAAARIPSDSALVQVLSEERAGAERSLVGTLERWSRHGFQEKWRSRLEL